MLYFCDQVLGIIGGGFIFHRENQKKKYEEYQRLEFSFTLILHVLPEAAVTAAGNMVVVGGEFAGKKWSRGTVRPAALRSLKSVFTSFLLAFHPFFIIKEADNNPVCSK